MSKIKMNADEIKIHGLGLSYRALNVLKQLDVQTFQDLKQLDQLRLIRQRNCGRKTLKEIRDACLRMGFDLEEGDPSIGAPLDTQPRSRDTNMLYAIARARRALDELERIVKAG